MPLAVRTLCEIGGGFGEDGFDRLLAATAHEDRATRGLDDFVVVGSVVGGIRLDDIGAEFAGLAHERDDQFFVSIDLIAALGLVGLEDEWLDHQRHVVVIARGAEAGGVERRLAMEVGLSGHEEKVADHAGGIGLERADDRFVPMHELVEHDLVRGGVVEVPDVGAKHEGGFARAGDRLEHVGLADVHLNRIGTRVDERPHDGGHVFETVQERVFVKYSVVDGDIEAATVGREEPVEADFVGREHGRI